MSAETYQTDTNQHRPECDPDICSQLGNSVWWDETTGEEECVVCCMLRECEERVRAACMKAVVEAGHLKVPAYDGDDVCEYCDVPWPCATIEALERVQP